MDNNNAAETALAHQCPKCGKAFERIQGLRMHLVRVHTKAGRRGAMWARTKKFGTRRSLTHEEHLKARRIYQMNLRARYYREGKNSKGQPMPPGWKPRPRKKDRLSEGRRAYQRNWYRDNKNKKAQGKPVAAAVPQNIGGEVWVLHSSGVIHCPHCQKIVGEIKQQDQETANKWHVV